jgi:hypothetical protein
MNKLAPVLDTAAPSGAAFLWRYRILLRAQRFSVVRGLGASDIGVAAAHRRRPGGLRPETRFRSNAARPLTSDTVAVLRTRNRPPRQRARALQLSDESSTERLTTGQSRVFSFPEGNQLATAGHKFGSLEWSGILCIVTQ